MAEQNHARGTPRKFCEEFKRDAVEPVCSTDRSIAPAAKELAISETTLGHWVARPSATTTARGPD